MFKKELKPILKNYGYLLALTLIFRVGFYLYNRGSFELENTDLLLSFCYGLRFDLAAVSMLFTIYLLSLLTPFKKVHHAAYSLISVVMIYLYIVDIEYYQFVGKRVRIEVFGAAGDFLGQMAQISFYYWPVTILAFSLIYLFFKLFKVSSAYSFKKIGMVVLLLIINFVAIRGGLQFKSISPQNAFVHGDFKRGVLTLNPVYTFFRTINKKGVEKISFFEHDEQAISILRKNHQSLLEKTYPKQNVVILILESFAMEYLEYAPYLTELQNKALYFKKGIAGGRRSMEAMPSIFQSFPSLIGEPLYKTPYQTNKAETLPATLKKQGYQSAFFHGGELGTMGFDSYSLSTGFDRYYSRDDYPNQDHYDGNWGIFDHHYLEFFNTELGKMQEPFFASLFSLSSHHPYTIPKEFKGKFKEGPLPIHKTISYSDQALRDFFIKAEKEPWFKNTLFIITADHSQKRVTAKYQNIVGEYRVPIYFYHPSIDLKKYHQDKIISHSDIFPSVLELLGIEPNKSNLYGESIFKKGLGSALFQNGGVYFYLTDKKLTGLNLAGVSQTQSYDFESGKLAPIAADSELILKLKAYIQYTNNGLRQDKLYLPKP